MPMPMMPDDVDSVGVLGGDVSYDDDAKEIPGSVPQKAAEKLDLKRVVSSGTAFPN
jgi:hypothetical protein